MNLRSAFLLSIITSLFLTACTKIESTEIGSGLIPPVDNITTFDSSLNTVTHNFFDTGAVFPLRDDLLALGRVSNDPLFGKTTGIINLQLMPQLFKFRFNGIYDSLRIDSVVLCLAYKGTWGDTTQPTRLNVYEISSTTPLRYDSNYSTKSVIQQSGPILGSADVDVRKLVSDTLKRYNEAVNRQQLRIKITNTAYINRLFQDTLSLESDSAFRVRLPGLTVRPDTNALSPNSLMLVSLSDTNTKIAFYYSFRYVGGSRRDTASAYWRLYGRSGFSNQIIRNTVGAEFQQTLGAASDTMLYIQTRPEAPYSTIRIPGLDSMKNAIIHRAELQLQQVRSGPLDDQLTPPALFLAAYSTDSLKRFFTPEGDAQFSNTGVGNLAEFGAYPFYRNVNGQRVHYWNFNLTQYVQGIVTRKNRNYPLVVWAPFADFTYAAENFSTIIAIAGNDVVNPVARGRVRIGGGSYNRNSPYRLRLRIIYTRI